MTPKFQSLNQALPLELACDVSSTLKQIQTHHSNDQKCLKLSIDGPLELTCDVSSTLKQIQTHHSNDQKCLKLSIDENYI